MPYVNKPFSDYISMCQYKKTMTNDTRVEPFFENIFITYYDMTKCITVTLIFVADK